MDILQIGLYLISGLIAILVAVAGLLKLFGVIVNRAVQGERDARIALEKDLRAALKSEKEERQKAQFRIQELETLRVKDLQALEDSNSEIKELRSQVSTMVSQIRDLLDFKESAETKLQEKDAAITRLTTENDRLKDQNRNLFEANKDLQKEVHSFTKVFIWMGIQREEIEKISTDDITEQAAKVASQKALSKSEPGEHLAPEPEKLTESSEEQTNDGTVE